MKDIRNYTLSQFYKKDIETIQQYITLLAHIKPTDTKKEVFYMKLREVQDIKELMHEGTLDSLVQIISLTEDKTKEEVMEIKIVPFFSLINSVKEQLETIYRAEATSLVSKQPNFKWEAVGGSEKISKFGIYNTIDRLAGGDILKYEAVLDIPYADVFMKLYMDTVKSDLEYEMAQMKTKQ